MLESISRRVIKTFVEFESKQEELKEVNKLISLGVSYIITNQAEELYKVVILHDNC
ncbi:MAG: hypothetical protein HYY52_00110 [Candidatus Melainabacteria bacterium]|nr:hypothetical protein [Candidatus Melainabacteria bacterium]